MALEQEVKLSAPVPGMALTAEPKARPWRRPYQLNTVDEAATYYMEKMLTAEFTEGLIEQVEVGFPLSTIADVFISISTMEGVHSIDLGALVSPVIIELMKATLDSEGVKYEVGDEDDQLKMSQKEMIKMRDELIGKDDLEMSSVPDVQEEEPMEEMADEEMPNKRGLMSRK